MKKLNVVQMENVNGGGCSRLTLVAGLAIGITGFVVAAPVLLGTAVVGLGAAAAGMTLGAAGISVSIVDCL